MPKIRMPRKRKRSSLPIDVSAAFDLFVESLFTMAPELSIDFDSFVQDMQQIMRQWATKPCCLQVFYIEQTQLLVKRMLCVLGKCITEKTVRLLWKQFYFNNFHNVVINAASLHQVPKYDFDEPQMNPKNVNLDKIRKCRFDTLLLFHADATSTPLFLASHDIPDTFVDGIQRFFESRNIHVSRNLDIAMKQRVLVVVVASQRLTSLYLQCRLTRDKLWSPRFTQLKCAAHNNTLYLQCSDMQSKPTLPKLFRNMTTLSMIPARYLHSLNIIEQSFFASF